MVTVIHQRSNYFRVVYNTIGMILVLHIILALSAGKYPRVQAFLQGDIIEEISNQLHSDGKEVSDCDAILDSSPGLIDYSVLQHASSAHCSLKDCAVLQLPAYFQQCAIC